MTINFDLNAFLRDVFDRIAGGDIAFWQVFVVLLILTAPRWIAPLSKAIAEHRRINIKKKEIDRKLTEASQRTPERPKKEQNL